MRRYWSCQFQLIVEGELSVKVTLLELPVDGILPVPVQPVVMYWAPVPADTGEVTDSVMDVPALSHPVVGVGVSWADVTVRKY